MVIYLLTCTTKCLKWTHFSRFCPSIIPYILAQGNPARKSMLCMYCSFITVKILFLKKGLKQWTLKYSCTPLTVADVNTARRSVNLHFGSAPFPRPINEGSISLNEGATQIYGFEIKFLSAHKSKQLTSVVNLLTSWKKCISVILDAIHIVSYFPPLPPSPMLVRECI